ncbi:hypothetical protein TSAR_005515 [Trichomalopsis sarcophagae]|uniref:Calreticulin n=1 Tax=Trichomalopsis sarcophagae TaxID=543379 RepID=A0A232EHP9_9HYME|nr:hypothetical protein TSAR_005515 [Trichomalopsis sarcophagae]
MNIIRILETGTFNITFQVGIDRLNGLSWFLLPASLVVRPDNTFEVKVDGNVVNEDSLLDYFTPPVNPPLQIKDPNDKRPEDRDEREKIPDPIAVKPEDWDEDAPAQIVNENDQVPEGWIEDEPPTLQLADWAEEMDGEWEPPEI